jgi:hypothetical protein
MNKARLIVLLLTLLLPIIYAAVWLHDVKEIEEGTSSALQARMRGEACRQARDEALQFLQDRSRLREVLIERECEEGRGEFGKRADDLMAAFSQAIQDKMKEELKNERFRLAKSDLVMPLAPLVSLGLLSGWVLSPGQARKRLRLVAQVALAGWIVFLALRLALGDWSPRTLGAELTRAITLWVAGAVPCLLILARPRSAQH